MFSNLWLLVLFQWKYKNWCRNYERKGSIWSKKRYWIYYSSYIKLSIVFCWLGLGFNAILRAILEAIGRLFFINIINGIIHGSLEMCVDKNPRFLVFFSQYNYFWLFDFFSFHVPLRELHQVVISFRSDAALNLFLIIFTSVE
jgi:hypothetical protein